MKRRKQEGQDINARIDIHADDYALTVGTSEDMLSCMEKGQLDSISIVPNMTCFEECMELLYQAIPKLPFLPAMSVHLDFVEGRSLAGTECVPLLVRAGSNLMGMSWGGLFIASYLPWKRRTAREQLKREIKVQIETAQAAINRAMELAKEQGVPCGQHKMRIDSHQHAHMIPVVWDALIEVIREERYEVEYIRNSKEMLIAFVSETSLWKTYRPINFIKNILLSLYSHKVEQYSKNHNLNSMYLWGLIMSGHMDYDRIAVLYPKIVSRAEKDNRILEILFHPGQMLPDEVSAEIGSEAAEDFYLREDRHVEMDALGRIRPLLKRR